MWVWTHLNRLFRETIFRPLGVLAPEIFTRARDCLRLVSAHCKPGRGPPKNFKGEHLKLGLEFHVCASITLGVVGVTSRNFAMGCGVITYTPTNLGGPKTSKIWRDFQEISNLIANISGKDRRNGNLKSIWWTIFHPVFGEKKTW